MPIDTGSPDWALRFDNTVRVSTIYRLHDADDALIRNFNADGSAQAINFNQGDENFHKRGFVSERLDLLSEFDAVYQRRYGFRISGAGWYDAAYHRDTQAPNDPLNGQSPPNHFQSYTREIAGQKAEVLDAFVFGGADVGDAGKVSARLGQHTILYGESLFFGDNGIAAAQGPVDIQKLLSSPNAQFKEVALPVPQLSAQWQIRPSLSLGGYVQFRWRESRVPPSGSYFSAANIPWNASSPEYVGLPPTFGPIAGNYVAQPGSDVKPRNTGQFGLELKFAYDETDYGLYYARYHDKTGQLYGRLDVAAKDTGSTWYYQFPSDIKVFGLSASRSVGPFNLAGEASIRDNMPLVVNNAIYFAFPGAPEPASPALPRGRTAHINVSSLASFGPTFIAQESAIVAELAWNRALSKNDPDHEIDAGRTRDASIIQFIFTPTYRQVTNGLDLSVPIGARYTLDGRSSVTAWGPPRTGNLNVGLDGNYLNVWQFSFNYTKYLGASIPLNDYGRGRMSDGNALGDRDYVSFNVRRTF